MKTKRTYRKKRAKRIPDRWSRWCDCAIPAKSSRLPMRFAARSPSTQRSSRILPSHEVSPIRSIILRSSSTMPKWASLMSYEAKTIFLIRRAKSSFRKHSDTAVRSTRTIRCTLEPTNQSYPNAPAMSRSRVIERKAFFRRRFSITSPCSDGHHHPVGRS